MRILVYSLSSIVAPFNFSVCDGHRSGGTTVLQNWTNTLVAAAFTPAKPLELPSGPIPPVMAVSSTLEALLESHMISNQ